MQGSKEFWVGGFTALLAVISASALGATPANEGKTVTRERFNKVVKVLVNTVKRQQELEAEVTVMQNKLRQVQEAERARGKSQDAARETPVSAPTPTKAGAQAEAAVDLDALDAGGGESASSQSATGGEAAATSGYKKGGDGSSPHLNVYFDFYIMSQPGKSSGQGSGFTFNNIHHFFLIEATAGPDIKFMTEIRDDPRFFELDYQFTRWFQLRLGKIWVPFDDLVPHNQFGGHMNVSRLRPTTQGNGTASAAFLPDLWAELGVAGKFSLIDRENFALEAHTYVVNGFGSGGTDPVSPAVAGLQYPNFGDSGIETIDNNREKSLGTRVHAMFAQTVGLGLSYYTGRWTDKDKEDRGVVLYGADSQVYLGRFTFRMGYTNAVVKLPSAAANGDYNRPGYYMEGSYKFGGKRDWKALLITGGLNGDNRIIDVNDRQISGAKLLYRPNNIEWGIEHFRDFRRIAAKDYRSFTAFRVIAMF